MEIPQQVVSMVDPVGFDQVFEEQLPEFVGTGLTYKDTFHALNSIYRCYFGIKRYATYDSFRRVRRRRIRMRTLSHL